jgi:enamine deaminase RidA (YjgF/YER057c/UK114 family)
MARAYTMIRAPGEARRLTGRRRRAIKARAMEEGSMRRLISTGSPFEADYAYSRAVVQGDWCFVAGTTGYDYATMTMPEEVGAQAANALATIGRALAEAGFVFGDVVRTVVYLVDAADHPRIAPALRAALGDVRPANTTVVTALTRPEMKVEIEVTALRG